jgi:hypothetical protein
MQEYTINVGEIEELQMIKDTDTLDQMFTRAKSTIVQGGSVILERRNPDGTTYRFDEITTEVDLMTYKETVFKHL